ncbi:Cadherin domain containing protein 3, partial [Sarcoptes scabiei]
NIEDVNDNAPRFPTKQTELEFPENSKPKDVKRTLPPAIDLDRAILGTQSYQIISGNVANAFRLISHREKDDILYLDLQVNGVLDRETIANYQLVIEASDGGQPPLKDQLLVNINILDHNDCEPVFSQNHYYSSVTENVTLGTSILKITATDNDEGDNGKIIYSLHQRQQSSQSLLNSKSDTTNQFDSVIDSTPSSAHFAINPRTGWISIIKPLDHESQDLHELVVIAKDQGVQPLQTSAFVSIRVSDINDNQPIVSVIFLTKNSKPMLREDATVGELVARISINDADALASDSSLSSSSSSMKAKKSSSKRFSSYHSFSVSLFGASDGEFGLKTTDQIVYLIVVTAPLDREKISKYHLIVMVSDDGHPPQNTTVSFDLDVIDVNDNPPRFDQTVYHVTLPETIEIGSK